MVALSGGCNQTATAGRLVGEPASHPVGSFEAAPLGRALVNRAHRPFVRAAREGRPLASARARSLARPQGQRKLERAQASTQCMQMSAH